MHYQVVANRQASPEQWEYYPYWAPVRDKATAERLAHYAAHMGYEAAILHSVSVEMLEQIARKVIEQHDSHLLPALRYLPETAVASAGGRREHDVETLFHTPPRREPPHTMLLATDLERRRHALEMGPGGDVTIGGSWRPQDVSFPLRMDVLSAWLRLRARVEEGVTGGPEDGADDTLTA